jgi:hypothetical protein
MWSRVKKGWFELVVVDGQEGQKYASVVRGPIFSPDSQRVAYVARNGSMERVVVDGQEGPAYDISGIGGWWANAPIFSPDSQRVAYVAKRGWPDLNGWSELVVDGQAGPEYDRIRFAQIFSPDSRHVAYLAKKGEKVRVVVDGREGPKYDISTSRGDLSAKRPIFSPDSRHVAYLAWKGEKVRVVVDGQEGPEYDRIYSDLVFNPDGVLEYLATKEHSLYRVKHTPIRCKNVV